ncbi:MULTISPECIES: AlpA family transcriptional regulator [unclassified Roseibium]|uniref:helix-turn-helix transcriptional regulator n=1 Tax=unclassified Roseibium TaxID=2629323 RepID=UPI00274029B4|nr:MULTISPECIES: AlpA family phage regulatory protein [unclassified Roseibium]
MSLAEDNLTLLKLSEVKNRVSLGSSTIYRYIDAGRFPRPRQVGRGNVRWLEHEINDWIRGLPVNDKEMPRP